MRVPLPSHSRSCAPKARFMPVVTMRRPHSSVQTAPIRKISVSVPDVWATKFVAGLGGGGWAVEAVVALAMTVSRSHEQDSESSLAVHFKIACGRPAKFVQ